ncbi:unnamed protein product [Soboliphyme baturini]|uniref:Uncharacterized protein n=1 Tax=Soboliphyme baturini TaxID=241478 RepID=A0A183IHU3_9BILA|nr:unnamed protein product [Soboliphyme baturini]
MDGHHIITAVVIMRGTIDHEASVSEWTVVIVVVVFEHPRWHRTRAPPRLPHQRARGRGTPSAARTKACLLRDKLSRFTSGNPQSLRRRALIGSAHFKGAIMRAGVERYTKAQCGGRSSVSSRRRRRRRSAHTVGWHSLYSVRHRL